MYAIDYTEVSITEMNGVNDHQYKSYDKFEDYEIAKNELLAYWITLKEDAIMNIKNIKKM